MKRTLYPKLLAGYLMYGLIGFVIIATFTYHLTFNFLQRKEAASLYRESALISSEYAQNYFSQSITLEELQKQLTTLSTYLSGEIWIMDTRGNILLNTASSLDDEQKRIKDFDVTDFGNSYYRVGDFYQTFSSEMLSVFSPITVNYKVRGYVIIHKPISRLVSSANGLTHISYQTLALLFLAAFIVLILFTYVVYIPIRKITRGADRFASGNFEEKIDVHSNDEIGYLAASLNYMANELNTLEEDQKKFVSNVSHELKTPITSMKVLSESILMQDNVPVEMYREFMNDIVLEIDREAQIISDLLTLVKTDKGSDSLNIERVDINELMEVILKRLTPLAEKRSIEITFESFREVEADIDKVKFTLAISNLIENGIKYNVDGGWIRVSLNADHKNLYIKVADSGVGIPEDCVEHIFERFYRVDKARSRDTGGTGLGLAISKNIIVMHKGIINVYSEPGKGTTFTVRVPMNYVK